MPGAHRCFVVLRQLAILWAGCLIASVANGALGADGWLAGAAKVKITPENFMWMSGYGSRDKPADGILTDLWAKALVLDDGRGHRAVLVTLDLVGVDRQLAQRICGRLRGEHRFERDQVAIAVSHTHSGPVVGRNLAAMHYLRISADQQRLVDEYAESLVSRVVDVVGQATRSLAPAQVSWGSGHAEFAVNRRTNQEAKVPELRAAGQLLGPVDHDVPVLAVRDPGGQLRAVAFGYACHATVLSGFQWCADYPGYAQLELERRHPDCVALFWAGCGADQNPLPRREVELAKQYGLQLAEAVDAVVAGQSLKSLNNTLATKFSTVPLPLDALPSRESIEADAKSTNEFVVSRAKMLLAELDAGRPLSPAYPYPIGRWVLGDDVEWIFLGGEVVVDYALRLKGERRGKQTWVTGYANDVMAYIPSRRVLMEGGYEGGGAMVYYGLPTIWGPEVEHIVVEGVNQIGK